ncbi:PQQ-binding-like beta-propeller repeat protein [Gordonia otitidis]|uniref:PQQ-binding-like beta-propeller repeat protein n=1 Tax=Gordonia otitidis TaxID=249058 RepID=UPI0003067C3F|nr:PQQ-binding-like beta-propeller repeat protein [Gordonia otitidis]
MGARRYWLSASAGAVLAAVVLAVLAAVWFAGSGVVLDGAARYVTRGVYQLPATTLVFGLACGILTYRTARQLGLSRMRKVGAVLLCVLAVGWLVFAVVAGTSTVENVFYRLVGVSGHRITVVIATVMVCATTLLVIAQWAPSRRSGDTVRRDAIAVGVVFVVVMAVACGSAIGAVVRVPQSTSASASRESSVAPIPATVGMRAGVPQRFDGDVEIVSAAAGYVVWDAGVVQAYGPDSYDSSHKAPRWTFDVASEFGTCGQGAMFSTGVSADAVVLVSCLVDESSATSSTVGENQAFMPGAQRAPGIYVLVALDAQTGQRLWTRLGQHLVVGQQQIVGHAVPIVSPGRLTALEPRSGTPEWSIKSDLCFLESDSRAAQFVTTAHHLAYTCGDRLVVLDADTGRDSTHSLPGADRVAEGLGQTGIVGIAGDRVSVFSMSAYLGNDSYVSVVDLSTGTTVLGPRADDSSRSLVGQIDQPGPAVGVLPPTNDVAFGGVQMHYSWNVIDVASLREITITRMGPVGWFVADPGYQRWFVAKDGLLTAAFGAVGKTFSNRDAAEPEVALGGAPSVLTRIGWDGRVRQNPSVACSSASEAGHSEASGLIPLSGAFLHVCRGDSGKGEVSTTTVRAYR